MGCEPAVIHITDVDAMQALMQRNIALNQLHDRVKATVYDWGNERPHGIPHHPDIVLAADCVYFEPSFPLLQQTLQDLIGPDTVCFFCFKRRRRADMHFLKAIKKVFLVEEVMDDPDQPSYSRENIFLYAKFEHVCFSVQGLADMVATQVHHTDQGRSMMLASDGSSSPRVVFCYRLVKR